MKNGPQSDFKLPPFIPIFLELDKHLRLGKMSLTDLGVYQLLNRWCEWGTGIYYGCAATIAALVGGRAMKAEVQRSLGNLRRKGFINYRFGRGSRGSYNILIHGFLPREGELIGYRLNAFGQNSLEDPVYEPVNGQETLDGLSTNGGQTVGEPLQEYKKARILEPKNEKVGRLVGKRVQPAAAVLNDPPLSFSPDGRDREPVINEGGNPFRVESERQVDAADDPHAEPTPCAESDTAVRLASRFFELQGSPAKFDAELTVWDARFRKLLLTYGGDLAEMMEYAFTQDHFWSQKLIRNHDPLGYFEEKLASGRISENFRQWQTRMNNQKTQVQSKVDSNGQQHSRADNGIAGKQPVDDQNRAAAEEAKRQFAELFGWPGKDQRDN